MKLTRIVVLALSAAAAMWFPAAAQTANRTPPSGMTCPGDKVVWVNTRSHVYHFQGERYFGNTKNGKFMCERDADREGNRPTHNGQ